MAGVTRHKETPRRVDTDCSDLSHGVPEIGTPLSLAVIVVVLAVTTVASLLRTRNDPDTREGARVLVAPAGEERQPR